MPAKWVYIGGPSGPNGQGGAAQVLAAHAALLPAGPAGQILYFSGSQWVPPTIWESIQNDPDVETDPSYLDGKREIDHSRIYDCRSQLVSNPTSPDADLFCAGHAFLPDGRLLVAGGTQHFPVTGTIDLHHGHWSGSRETWIFDPHSEIRAAIGSSVTAAWAPRSPDHLDLFLSSLDGVVWSTWWEAATGWQPWFAIHPEVKAAVGAPVTAVWAPHQPDHLDLFMTGTDGAVWSTWWERAHGWQPWFTIHPEVKSQPRVSVTALWRGQHLDLFMTGTDGTVRGTWWEAAPSWQPWFAIHPEVKAAVGAPVTAVWAPHQPDHLDLFMTGTDGAVWSTWWERAHSWQPWFTIHPEVKSQPRVSVTALWRGQHLDLFMTGTDGTVWSTWWEAAPSWQPWFAIHPEVKAAVGAPVTAVWAPHQPDHLDLFMTGTDGAVWSTWWERAHSWQPWFTIHPEVKSQPRVSVTALWRGQHLDLFMTGTDGTVRGTWWEAAPSWQPWFAIHPEVKAAVGAPVTAVWAPHQPDHLDLFMTGTDGAVWSTWWERAHSWQPWFTIHPEVKSQPRVSVTALWRGQHLDLFMTGTDGTVWSTWWEAAPNWQPWFAILASFPWIRGPLLNRDPGQTENNNEPMGGGRWYPTLITLPTGEVFAICGHPLIYNFTKNLQDFDIRHNNTKPEVFNSLTGTWTVINKALGTDQAHDYAPYYPRLHIVPHTGEVLIVQPLYSKQVVPYDQRIPNCTAPPPGQDLCSQNPLDTDPPYNIDPMDNTLFYDVGTQQVTRAFPGPQHSDALYVDRFFTSQETTSVMLPLLHEENYHSRVLLAGATLPLIADLAPQSPTPLQWTNTAPRQLIDSGTVKPPVRN